MPAAIARGAKRAKQVGCSGGGPLLSNAAIKGVALEREARVLVAILPAQAAEAVLAMQPAEIALRYASSRLVGEELVRALVGMKVSAGRLSGATSAYARLRAYATRHGTLRPDGSCDGVTMREFLAQAASEAAQKGSAARDGSQTTENVHEQLDFVRRRCGGGRGGRRVGHTDVARVTRSGRRRQSRTSTRTPRSSCTWAGGAACQWEDTSMISSFRTRRREETLGLK